MPRGISKRQLEHSFSLFYKETLIDDFVHRYNNFIKVYWSKMMVRDTVLSEEQERKLLDRILKEEVDYSKQKIMNEET